MFEYIQNICIKIFKIQIFEIDLIKNNEKLSKFKKFY